MQVVRDMTDKEVSAGRMCGPFDTPPFDNYLSPLSIHEKKESRKFRVIHDLSYPYNHLLINSGIDGNFTTAHYEGVHHAVRQILHFSRNSFFAKTDIKSAFRLIPIVPE